MSYFLRKRSMKNGDIQLQIYESFHEHGKKWSTTKHYKSFGMLSKLIKSGIKDPIKKCENEVKKLNEREKILKHESTQNEVGEDPVKNYGYFLIKNVINKLGVNVYLKMLSMVEKTKYRVDDVIESFIYSRIVQPSSVFKNYDEVIPTLYNRKNIKLPQLYESLDIFGERYEDIIKLFNDCHQKAFKRNINKVYFDCTNFYFEIDQEDELRRKGPSKENRKSPIVGMALLLDQDAIPLSMKIYPGNESEKPKLREIISDMRESNNINGRTIHVADKGLNCTENIIDSINNGDGYIYSQSIKKLNEQEQKWALLENEQNVFEEYKNNLGEVIYKIKSCVDTFEYKFKNKIYKIKQKRLVTFNKDLAIKQRKEIEREIEKLKGLCISKAKREEYGDLAKYLKINKITHDGEIEDADYALMINQEKIENDLRLCGYNMIITSEINSEDNEIYKIYHNLWKIERSFRILKTNLESRPIYVRLPSHIKAHFLICYLSIYLLKILETKVFKNRYTIEELISYIRDLKCFVSKSTIINLLNRRSSTYKFLKENDIKLTYLNLIEKDFDKLIKFKYPTTIKK